MCIIVRRARECSHAVQQSPNNRDGIKKSRRHPATQLIPYQSLLSKLYRTSSNSPNSLHSSLPPTQELEEHVEECDDGGDDVAHNATRVIVGCVAPLSKMPSEGPGTLVALAAGEQSSN
ncbi:hypothetical protein PENSPDRAFT_672366 [Peniophora sp. CONT]|nr:hypothetical protein PENSPDRAFT_672366 [Peniophora sp. CONT]